MWMSVDASWPFIQERGHRILRWQLTIALRMALHRNLETDFVVFVPFSVIGRLARVLFSQALDLQTSRYCGTKQS